MSKEIAVPDYIRALTDAGDSSAEQGLISAGSSVPRISLKGFKFRFIEEGEEVKVVKESINMVILGSQPEHGMAKTFYKDTYNPEDTEPPTCSSTDGVRPDSWVSDPVSTTCAACVNNKWGSAKSTTGKKAKACRDSKRLMVVDPENIEEGTVYILNVTVASLRAMSEYGKLLVANKLPMASAITQFTFADGDYPALEFDFVGVLKEDLFNKSMKRSAEKEWDEVVAGPAIEHKPQNDSPVLGNTSAATKGEVQESGDVGDVLDQWGDSSE
jgi:hypothetical protein